MEQKVLQNHGIQSVEERIHTVYSLVTNLLFSSDPLLPFSTIVAGFEAPSPK
jgi:hypothetical protein